MLRQLAPGTYTVTAPEVKSALGTLTSDPSSVTISLGRNDHQAVSIPYQLHPAALNPRGNAADFAIQSRARPAPPAGIRAKPSPGVRCCPCPQRRSNC